MPTKQKAMSNLMRSYVEGGGRVQSLFESASKKEEGKKEDLVDFIKDNAKKSNYKELVKNLDYNTLKEWAKFLANNDKEKEKLNEII